MSKVPWWRKKRKEMWIDCGCNWYFYNLLENAIYRHHQQTVSLRFYVKNLKILPTESEFDLPFRYMTPKNWHIQTMLNSLYQAIADHDDEFAPDKVYGLTFRIRDSDFNHCFKPANIKADRIPHVDGYDPQPLFVCIFTPD